MEENIITMPLMSAEISEISAALSAFQGDIKQPKLTKEVKVKTKTGGEYKFKYADLSACVEAASPMLKAHGLAVTQLVSNHTLHTLLTHKSGQWFRSELPIGQVADYQALGSAITYLKRYSYCAILGIVADTDDDANAACGNLAEFSTPKKTATKKAKEPTPAAKDPEPQVAPMSASDFDVAVAACNKATTLAEMMAVYNKYPDLHNNSEFMLAMSTRRKEIEA